MTIPTSSARNDYDGTDITGPYPITWKFFENADLLVTVDGVVKTLTTDYTATGAGEQAGGSLTFTAAISAGAKISIEPRGAFDQETDIRNEGGNLRVAIEDRFDRLCRDDQVLKGLADRSLKVRTNEASTFDCTLPEPTANYTLAVNAANTGFKLVAPSSVTAVGAGTDLSDGDVLATGSIASRALGDRFAERFNVLDYGAVGDGVTDDTAAIAAAFAAAAAARMAISSQESGALPSISGYVTSATGPIVYFPPKKFRISASVGAGANNVRVFGDGALLISSDRTITLLSLGTFNVHVEGMIFDGGKYHITFGGSRVESGNMFVNSCQFRNAKTRCIFMPRLTDIPGFSGWPANLRIRDVKSYGSGFLEAYGNGVTIADSWLAWDVSGTTWDGGALIIANDNVNCYNICEVPFNQAGPGVANAGRIPRFQDATGFASEDFLQVHCFACRFGGEATQTPLAHFRTAGSSLLIEGGGVYGVADGYWLHCDAMPSRITVRAVAPNLGFENTWGMWFNSALTLANLPAMCAFDLEIQSATPAASHAIISADKTVRGGTRMAYVPSHGLPVAMRLRNYDVGDSFTFWAAPYGADASGAAFGGGATLLGYTTAGIISYSAEGFYGITFPGFNPAVAGAVTFSCWVKATSRSAWYFQNGTINVAGGVLEPGMNRVVATFYHAGAGATTPKIGFTGKSGDAHVVGFFNFNLGSVAGDWQPASIANDGGMLYGSATYDPANLADGAGATTTVACIGAALGDFARATFSLDIQGMTLSAWVSAADTVSVRFQNESGGALDLGSGTLRVRVEKA
jgi:hypothetical protein